MTRTSMTRTGSLLDLAGLKRAGSGRAVLPWIAFAATLVALTLTTGCTTSPAPETTPGATPESSAAVTPSAADGAGSPTAERRAPLLEGLGDHRHPVATRSPLAQRYFDQGLILAYGFNHAEAARSFREAARIDPECAMCWWGVALVLGPNINAAMEPENNAEAWQAVQRALELSEDGDPRERAYIEALATRYAEQPPEDRSHLDLAFAEAMGKVVHRFPDDLDAATLYAEALMDTMPWDYWQEDGSPKPATREVLAQLDRVIEGDPRHPGALHLYLHAVEEVHPEWGEDEADRLAGLVPGAGHLVHMPSHIYIRVGRYEDAAEANRKAIAADDAYVTQCHAQGLYPVGYMPHNHHFLWAAATFQGDSETALEAARHTAHHVDRDLLRAPGYGTLQHYLVTPIYTLARFGRWDEILAYPRPEEDLLYPEGVWRYARALALIRKNRPEEAQRELTRLRQIAADPALDDVTLWGINGTSDLLEIAAEVVAGELAAARGNTDEAVRSLEVALDLESTLLYDEPPAWHQSVRQVLGAVLLEAGRTEEAERVYREDLAKFPNNGWSLHGLAEALETQGRTEEAAQVRERLRQAWRNADVTLIASRF